jgi:hypothetical protein
VPRLRQNAERTDGTEHSSATFCFLRVPPVGGTPSRWPPKRFKCEDARARTLRHSWGPSILALFVLLRGLRASSLMLTISPGSQRSQTLVFGHALEF